MLYDVHVYGYLWIMLSNLRWHGLIQPSFINGEVCK